MNEYRGVKLSEKNAEYFLFLFKSLKMWPEIVDFCENYQKLTNGGQGSDIKSYYLSEALMQMSIGKAEYFYYNLLEDAVFKQEYSNDSPCYITSLTKAYFKDGNVDYALKFFEKFS